MTETAMPLSLILDIAIIVLLVPTIFFAVILNSRLADLRRNRDDLARLINTFNDATQRAETGVPRLRKAADEAGRALQDRVEKAQILRDDLAFMVDRAESMAGRLDARTRNPASAAMAARAAARQDQPRQDHSRQDHSRQDHSRQDLRHETLNSDVQTVQQAIAAVGLPSPPPIGGRRGAAGKGLTLPATAESPSQSPRPKGSAKPSPRDEDDFFVEDERSEAERELLRALQSAR